VLLPTLGSAGDVHPYIALGAALEARGHRATIITTPLFQPLIEAQGLGYLPVGTLEQVRIAIAHPDLWHLRKGFEVLAQVFIPAIEQIYRLIETHADADTVVAFSTGAFGARVAQEKLDALRAVERSLLLERSRNAGGGGGGGGGGTGR